jgi:CPA2 family monovalent cation:H+ antiporter-2
MSGIDFIHDLTLILAGAAAAGWVFRRVGLPVTAGYLIAGLLLRAGVPWLTEGGHEDHVNAAAKLGLVFLMFSVGLRMSLRKLRRLGVPLLIAVCVAAALICYLTRMVGTFAGLGGLQTLFLAAVMMVSSSTIIDKLSRESGTSHERVGQLTTGVSMIEGVIAIIMMAVLSSLVQFESMEAALGGDAGTHLGQTLSEFGGFVVLAGVAGLLLVPWLLHKMSITVDGELQAIGTTALLFGLALLAQHVGYSLAMGAFLLGVIMAETSHRYQIERIFGGVKDVFGAVFFVAVGMQVNLPGEGRGWALIAGVAALTVTVRTVAVSVGLAFTGTPAKDALRVGLATTPIGEFSFVIIQMGVAAQVVGLRVSSLVVMVALLTALATPWLTRHSERISEWMFAKQPRWLAAWLEYYRGWIERLEAKGRRIPLWQLTKKRIVQIAVELLLVAGLLVFAEQILTLVKSQMDRSWLLPNGGVVVIFWVLLIVIVTIPLVAIWRNLSALSLLYAQVATHGQPRASRLRPLVETILKTVSVAGLLVWVGAFLPTSAGLARWVVPATVVIVAGTAILLQRKLVYWHSEMEVEVQEQLAGGPRSGATVAPWLHASGDWNLCISECVLPDLADCQGRSIAELDLRARFGVSVVGIERQGYMISLPVADTVLYPHDKLLLMGGADQVKACKDVLVAVSGALSMSDFDDLRLESLHVPKGSPAADRTLRDLAPARSHLVQITGLNRGQERILSPRGDEKVQPGDELLVLGTPDHIGVFRAWINEGVDSLDDLE